MLASVPASMLNQNSPDLGIPNRIELKTSRFSQIGFATGTGVPQLFVGSRPDWRDRYAILAILSSVFGSSRSRLSNESLGYQLFR